MNRLVRIWWLDPVTLFPFVVGSTILLAAALPASAYQVYGTPKYLNWSHVALAALGVLGFVVGNRCAYLVGWRPRTAAPHLDQRLAKWFLVAVTLTLIGYGVWTLVALRNGLSLQLLRDFLFSSDAEVSDRMKYEVFSTIPGVTTAAQFGIAAVILGTWLWMRGRRWVGLLVVLVLAVSFCRAILHSERLSLLELVVPAAVVWLRFAVLGHDWGPAARLAIRCVPFAALLVALLAFGAAEYLRSWRYHHDKFDSFGQFTVIRFSGYYATAYNNAALALETGRRWPLPYETLKAVWKFPPIRQSPLSYPSLTGIDPEEAHMQALGRFANREFNNGGGLFLPVLDYGTLGYGIFWLAYGWLTGLVYRGYLAGSVGGMLFYPILFVSLLETPRILCLFSSRTFPTLVLCGLLVLTTSLSRRGTGSEEAVAEPTATGDEPAP